MTAEVLRGSDVFESRGCSDCHRPPTYTTADVYDVGLVDEKGERYFNPPSLRGVSQRHSFLHDARSASLEGVLKQHPTPGGPPLSEIERADLLRFLESL